MRSNKSSSGAGTLPGLEQRLLWITAFRVIATTLLLVVLSTRLLSRPPESLGADDTRSFGLIGLVYLLCIGYALPLRAGSARRWLAYAQIAGDVLLATVLIAQTGGLESPFSFVYLLAVLSGAVLLGRRGAVLAAVLGAFTLLARTFLLEAMDAPGWMGPQVEPRSRMLLLLFSNLLGQFLIAWLASYLSDQLLRTGGRLLQREADFSALESLHEQILRSMSSGLITCRMDGRVTFLNRAGAAILGRTVTSVEGGESIERLIPGVLQIPLGSMRNELRVPTPLGKKVLGLSVTSLEGTERELLIVFQDLTVLRRTEDELRNADRLAALGRLSAQLAHEIRNPLASMRGSAQLLAEEAPAEGQLARLSGILIRESDRLSSMVEDFLRFARPTPPTLRPTPLNELAAQVLEMLRCDPLARDVRLVDACEPVLHPVDADQMRQVLINLVRNACAAVGPGGKVRVSVVQDEQGARLRVWDSGGGIPSEDLPLLFEPFFSRRPNGTGLGLSTAHSIVHAHGGTIEVTSTPESGTEFVISLPKAAEEAR